MLHYSTSQPPERVALVGAGPGNPGLLTLRGRELLAQADVVLADRLAGEKLRKFAPQSEWIDVGKRPGDRSMLQEQINRLLIEHAQSGRRVVRLKGGDPFIFGRGGEECQALAEAGIAYEVVPGITAATAAGAYAGIPLTHRDLGSSVTFVAGQERDDGKSSTQIDWGALARMPCLAFYMSVKSLPNITLRLIEHGLAPDTPAACIERAGSPQQQTVVATIATIADAAASFQPPAIILIGAVVGLRQKLRWFDRRPLMNQRVVVTRTRVQASVLSAKLEALGAEVLEAPTIELVPPADWGEVDAALRLLADGATTRAPRSLADTLIFTSPRAVTATRERLFTLGLDSRALTGLSIAVVGDSTRSAVESELCCRVDVCPSDYFLEALADELARRQMIAQKRFLLLRADIARPVLVERLRDGGAAEVTDLAVYETRRTTSLPTEVLSAFRSGSVDWVTFTSSSTAHNLVALLGGDAASTLASVKSVSIGPQTSAALRERGIQPTIEAVPHDLNGLVSAMLNHISNQHSSQEAVDKS